MSDLINDTREVVKLALIENAKSYFRVPGQIDWAESDVKKLSKLIDIATEFDAEDPFSWICAFDRSHPHDIEVGNETGRAGKILAFAEMYKSNHNKKTNKVKTSQREF